VKRLAILSALFLIPITAPSQYSDRDQLDMNMRDLTALYQSQAQLSQALAIQAEGLLRLAEQIAKLSKANVLLTTRVDTQNSQIVDLGRTVDNLRRRVVNIEKQGL